MNTLPGPRLAAAIYAVLALLYFLPALMPGGMLFGSDYLAGGHAFDVFTSSQLAAGELPRWVPGIYGGLPLLANPGSAFHPVHVLAAWLLPVHMVLPVVLLVHFFLAGVGTYALAGELGVRRGVAFLAGLQFQLTGLVLSWVYAGHDGRIIVVTSAPLALAFLQRGLRTGRWTAFAGGAATTGCALLSFQLQCAWYLLLLGGLWTAGNLVALRTTSSAGELGRRAALTAGGLLLALGLAATVLLPVPQYAAASPRGAAAGRGAAFATTYSASPADLLGAVAPDHVGSSATDPLTGEPLFPAYRGPNPLKLHTEYLGVLAVLLMAAGVGVARSNRTWRALMAVAVFFLTLALGAHTPLYAAYLALLPGLMRFRAPDLAYWVVALMVVLSGALALERMAQLRDERAVPRWLSLGGAFLVVVALVAAAKDDAAASRGWLRAAAFGALMTGALWAWLRRLGPELLGPVLLCVLVVVDQGGMGRRFFHVVPEPTRWFAPDDTVEFLATHARTSRAWVVPGENAYRDGGNDLMLYGISQVGGQHPLPLQRYVEFVGTSTGQLTTWENMAANPTLVDGPQGPTLTFTPNPALWDAANIRFVVSTWPLAIPGLREVHQSMTARVYENTSALPRAFLVPRTNPVANAEESLRAILSPGWDPRQVVHIEAASTLGVDGSATQAEVNVVEWAPAHSTIRTQSDGPVALVIAENHYPGWTATVDGNEVPVVYANHAFRAVAVPSGKHEVRMRFRPPAFDAGVVISLVSAALLALTALLSRRRGLAA